MRSVVFLPFRLGSCEAVCLSSYLYVFVNVKSDPVYGVEDEAQAHVRSGVVQIYEQVNSLCASFGPQLSVQLLGSPHLIRGWLCYGGTWEPRSDISSRHNTDFSNLQPTGLMWISWLTSARHLWSSGSDPSLCIVCQQPRLLDWSQQRLQKQTQLSPSSVSAFPSQCTPQSTHSRGFHHKWWHYILVGQRCAASVGPNTIIVMLVRCWQVWSPSRNRAGKS